jgi:alpha-L-fucosidase
MNTKKTAVPTAAQKAWMVMGYGVFLHFGPNTYQGVGSSAYNSSRAGCVSCPAT